MYRVFIRLYIECYTNAFCYIELIIKSLLHQRSQRINNAIIHRLFYARVISTFVLRYYQPYNA
ncbi:hypothetical protein [Priestia megaterium]|uniref:hypothetical protein n=1 Tax=Priestia megaterium TaxID=1404 RepID=UPI0011558789|nr:hypothetical protein [Priestia megaterium]